jgi:glycosyltransferase involved in cell wall biosynthesis
VESSEAEALVTVVIPVWDHYVAFLADAVESVGRTAPGCTILVVDNASSEPVSEHDGTTLIHTGSRLSAGAARNHGLEAVATEYVLFLDADDMVLEGALDFMCSRLKAEPSLSVAAMSILDGGTGRRHRTPRSFVPALARHSRFFALTDCIWSLYPTQGCATFRTDQVREAGGYADAEWGEDWVLAVSLAFRGRVEVSDRLGRFYRPTGGSLWRRPRSAADLATSARRVRERLRSDPAVPSWVKALLPAIGMLQLAAVYVIHPVYIRIRRRVNNA